MRGQKLSYPKKFETLSKIILVTPSYLEHWNKSIHINEMCCVKRDRPIIEDFAQSVGMERLI